MKRTTKQCLSLSLSLLMAAGVLPANALSDTGGHHHLSDEQHLAVR